MSTFSLLQISLDQPIERDSFLAAAGVSDLVTRADLMQHFRDLNGIVVPEIPHADALALQARFAALNYPVEVVADDDLPQLPVEVQVQRLEISPAGLNFINSMERRTNRAPDDLVFMAGGFLKTKKLKSEVRVNAPAQGKNPPPRDERVYRTEDVLEFRLEFFFWSEPHRLKLCLMAENTIFIQEKALQLHKKEQLETSVREVLKLLPAERTNLGLRDFTKVYPTMKAYQEEIRWHFHRLAKSS